MDMKFTLNYDYDFKVIENTDKYLKINETNIIGEDVRNIINQIVVEKDKMLLDVIYKNIDTKMLLYIKKIIENELEKRNS